MGEWVDWMRLDERQLKLISFAIIENQIFDDSD